MAPEMPQIPSTGEQREQKHILVHFDLSADPDLPADPGENDTVDEFRSEIGALFHLLDAARWEKEGWDISDEEEREKRKAVLETVIDKMKNVYAELRKSAATGAPAVTDGLYVDLTIDDQGVVGEYQTLQKAINAGYEADLAVHNDYLDGLSEGAPDYLRPFEDTSRGRQLKALIEKLER